MSALLVAVTLVAPTTGAMSAFAPHDVCVALHHGCGRMPHLVQCCCRVPGSASDLRLVVTPASSAGAPRSTVASAVVWVVAAALPQGASDPAARARPPDLLTLHGTLRI